MPRRLFREAQFRWSSGPWQFKYARLKPNLKEYIYTDCDAFSSLDPHEVVLLFTRLGYEVPTAPSFLRRLALRHVPVVLRKGGPASLEGALNAQAPPGDRKDVGAEPFGIYE
jgi:hypothetical protein